MATAVERAYQAIRQALVDGRVKQGERLKEEELAAEIGVSRTPIREALRRLDQEGLVNLVPNQGTHVSQWAARDVIEIFRLRAVLEAHAAGLAAERITPEAIAMLAELVDRTERIVQASGPDVMDQVAETNEAFHRGILQAAASPRLAAIVHNLMEIPIILGTFHRYAPADLRRSLDHHRELVAAFRARDPEWASSVMRSHVLAAKATYVRQSQATDLAAAD